MFKMPVGLYEKALPASMSWEERLTAAGQAGYDFVEISIDESDERLSRLDWSMDERADMRRAISNSGIPIMTMCLSGHRKYPLGSHDPAIRQQGQEILRKAIGFAGDVGLRVVQVMAYDVFYETSDKETGGEFCRRSRTRHPLGGRRPASCWAWKTWTLPLWTAFARDLPSSVKSIHPGCVSIRISATWLRPDTTLRKKYYSPKDK